MTEPIRAAVHGEPPSLPHGMSRLSDAECRALLSRQRLCVVSVVDSDAPYAVPVFYGFDGETIYLGVVAGRKTRALEANARVCVVVTEVAPDDTWCSVIVEGTARVLTDPAERESAARVLITHNRRAAGRSSTADGSGEAPPRRRHNGGLIIRVEDVRISGRQKR